MSATVAWKVAFHSEIGYYHTRNGGKSTGNPPFMKEGVSDWKEGVRIILTAIDTDEFIRRPRNEKGYFWAPSGITAGMLAIREKDVAMHFAVTYGAASTLEKLLSKYSPSPDVLKDLIELVEWQIGNPIEAEDIMIFSVQSEAMKNMLEHKLLEHV
jgi:hypothetical protein